MLEVWSYTLISVTVVSLISLVGVFTFSLNLERLERMLFYLVSFSAGALLGDVFVHILPELMGGEMALSSSIYILIGILIFFVLERGLMWHQSHTHHSEHVHSVAYLTIVGDALHNFLDGIAIAASFLVSIPVGLATATAVILHEIPQEIGQFAILIHGGWSRSKALLYNLLSALPAIAGALLVLIFSSRFAEAPTMLLGFGAASFIYVAMSDLIPELHKEHDMKRSAIQFAYMLAGIGAMMLLLLLE